MRTFLTNERWRDGVMIVLILLACTGYVFPRWADPNQNSRLNMVVAVVDDGTLRIDDYVSNTVDYAKVGDHYYSDKAPGAAFLGIPVYAGLSLLLDSPAMTPLTERLQNSSAFQSTLREEGSGVNTDKIRFALAQVVLSFVVSALPSALLAALIYLALADLGVRRRTRIVTVLAYGLFTPAFAYANAFYGHQLSAALLFAAFWFISRITKQSGAAKLLFIGLLLGYSVVTEYPTAVVVGILYIYAAYRLYRLHRLLQLGWITAAGAVVAMGWMAYNNHVFGGPLELGYSYSELWVDQHESGFMSLSLPHWDAVWGITFSGFRGIFVMSPWLLLAVPGFAYWLGRREQRAEWIVSLACVASIFLFNASSSMWWGGFSVGPRYLLPMLPWLVLAASFAVDAWLSRRWSALVTAAMILWSWMATWAVTLAGQAFPPDTIRATWIGYVRPSLQAGDVARNVGTLLGFTGIWSLLPLAVLVTGLGLVWWWLEPRRTASIPSQPVILKWFSR